VKSRFRLPGDLIFRLRLYQLALSLSLSRLFAHTLTRSRSLPLSLFLFLFRMLTRALPLSVCSLLLSHSVSRDVGGGGRYPDCPFFTFSLSNPFFGLFVPMNYPYHAPMNWYLRYVIRESCTSNAVTDAFVRRSLDFCFGLL